ncbi:OmpA family protein [Pedobacter ginsengisoli]|uniref:OmpA family protein n=1 Tax=Pedobacter ginsengisoli TaxID=363852 RepID=UPI00254F86A2|nr:OmpA family protein [Pedobacter ginsengisoli]
MKLNITIAFSGALILISCLIKNGYAQSNIKQSSAVTQATDEFKSLRYISAINKLSEILKTDSANVNAQEMIAYSYRMIKNYDQALKWYEKLGLQKNIKPEWALYYAEVLANKQQYERSEKWYRKYLTLVPKDKRAAVFARTNISNLNKNQGNWKISYLNINSQGSDYAPVYYKDGLLFTSNRQNFKPGTGIFLWNNTPFSNIFSVVSLKDIKTVNPDSLIGAAKKDQLKDLRFNDDDTAPTSNDTKTLVQYTPALQRDTIAVMLQKQISVKPVRGNINTRFHEGAAAVFPDGSIIFTRNNYTPGNKQTSKDRINKLKLYIASGKNLTKITEFTYNSNEYSTGHPTLSRDGNILVFTSDRPGGYGGSDLYYCVRSGNGQWTQPLNLGKQINTEGDEMFPDLDKNGTLIFASTGHPGLGGLDLFEVALKEMKPVSAMKNLGAPINSPTDDFAMIRAADGKSGFFSSNRRGDDDIYEFKRSQHMVLLEGTITDARTRLPLGGSRLLLRHLDGTDTLKVNNKGEFRKEISLETDYETTAQKIGYVNQLGFVTSVGIVQDSTIKLNIRLNKTESPQQYVLSNCDSLKKVFFVNNIYYDLDRSEIRANARPALDELAILMKKYPDISVITSSHCDTRASEIYNRNLSLRRGESAKAYLISKGIAPDRVKVEYYGKTRLVNRCYDDVPCSEEDQQLNRRTEFDVILNGVNITRQNCNER